MSVNNKKTIKKKNIWSLLYHKGHLLTNLNCHPKVITDILTSKIWNSLAFIMYNLDLVFVSPTSISPPPLSDRLDVYGHLQPTYKRLSTAIIWPTPLASKGRIARLDSLFLSHTISRPQNTEWRVDNFSLNLFIQANQHNMPYLIHIIDI